MTLANVLLSPLVEIVTLLGTALTKPAEPEPVQTMVEWVQSGLPAFASPEDIRGSFMDHVV